MCGMKARLGTTIVLALALAGCGPKDIDVAEVNEVLFPEKGVIGGYDFGVTWDEIQDDHNKVFKVRDDDDIKQLRRKVSDNAGSNGYFIGFTFGTDGGAESFHVSINGSKQNAVTVRKLLDEVIDRYDAQIGPGSCHAMGEGASISCHWVGSELDVDLMYYDLDSDPVSGGIDLNVRKAG